MTYPDFFDRIRPLTLRDPLAELLGAAEAGLVEYRYLDAVRLAGHSCPTVAGAWLMTQRALATLYPDSLPERGGMRIALRQAPNVANAGVVGAVMGLITGAAGEGGFQGLGGRMARSGLLSFDNDMTGDVCFTRIDTGARVELVYRPQVVAPDPSLQQLMPKLLSGSADAGERAEFVRLWQDRVRKILLDSAPGLVEQVAP
jgi:hypothetical protein